MLMVNEVLNATPREGVHDRTPPLGGIATDTCIRLLPVKPLASVTSSWKVNDCEGWNGPGILKKVCETFTPVRFAEPMLTVHEYVKGEVPVPEAIRACNFTEPEGKMIALLGNDETEICGGLLG